MQKVIEIALKLLFFPAKLQKSPRGRGHGPQDPILYAWVALLCFICRFFQDMNTKFLK